MLPVFCRASILRTNIHTPRPAGGGSSAFARGIGAPRSFRSIAGFGAGSGPGRGRIFIVSTGAPQHPHLILLHFPPLIPPQGSDGALLSTGMPGRCPPPPFILPARQWWSTARH